jgi:hypothetical protein
LIDKQSLKATLISWIILTSPFEPFLLHAPIKTDHCELWLGGTGPKETS